jgi:hypothetical protein
MMPNIFTLRCPVSRESNVKRDISHFYVNYFKTFTGVLMPDVSEYSGMRVKHARLHNYLLFKNLIHFMFLHLLKCI